MDNHFFIYFIFFLIVIELLLIILVNILKKNFKWLINKKDERPHFSKKNLKNFFKNSYDPYLGWNRKKNTKGYEISLKKTYFKISKLGCRGVSNYKNSKISVFGDSFAFCRYVNDNQTWESYLEKKINSNVFNFGVGNYGLDQSFLKYLRNRNKIKSKIIIFNFVPETIARINSYWKHYREFGNIMGFKPLLYFEKKKLKILKMNIKKNYSEKQICKQLNFIKDNDIFYKTKFEKFIFRFPYSINFFRNFSFFSKVFFYLLLSKMFGNKNYFNKAVSIFFKKNIQESHLMYDKYFFSKKLENLIRHINKLVTKNKSTMIMIISPQLLDLQSPYSNSYINFYKKISKEINCLDLTKFLSNKKNYDKYYLPDIYGGHLNENGNKLISSKIFNFIKKRKIL